MSAQGLLVREESHVYTDWKRYGHHLEEYASEFIGTLFSVFCVVGVVAWMFGASSPLPHAIPSPALRLFLTGLLLGSAGWLVALSPPGRLSGAHINPAVTVGFWTLGKMHSRDAAGYMVSQMAGAALGALLGHLVFGSLASEVSNAALSPGPQVGPALVFLGEVTTTFVLTFAIYTFVSHQSLMRWTPAMATVMVGLLVWLDGNLSGCGMNPARWFGPALSVQDWHLSWAYLFGPLLGAAFAAGMRRTGILSHPMPHTGKLFHDCRYRSVFKHDRIPTTPPTSLHHTQD